MFGLENSFLSALGPKLDFLPLEVMQTCWPTVGGGVVEGAEVQNCKVTRSIVECVLFRGKPVDLRHLSVQCKDDCTFPCTVHCTFHRTFHRK